MKYSGTDAIASRRPTLTSSHGVSRGGPDHGPGSPRREGPHSDAVGGVGRASTAPGRDSGLHLPPRRVRIRTADSAPPPTSTDTSNVSPAVGFIPRLKSGAFASKLCNQNREQRSARPAAVQGSIGASVGIRADRPRSARSRRRRRSIPGPPPDGPTAARGSDYRVSRRKPPTSVVG